MPTYYALLAQPTTLDPDAGKVIRETHWSAAEAMRLLKDVTEHAECAQGLDAVERVILGAPAAREREGTP